MLNTGQDARVLAGIRVDVRWATVVPVDPLDLATAASADTTPDLLTPFEAARYGSLRPDAARTFLAGRHLLRELTATLAGVDTADVSIEARCPFCGGPHGRPTVVSPPAAAQVQLGLAHTDSVVIAAAAWGHAVGVDVEETADAARTRERNAAIATVAGASGDDPLAHWTRVEAVLKADGRGLRVDPKGVRILDTGDTVEARIDGDGESRYALAALDLGAGFTASVAVRI